LDQAMIQSTSPLKITPTCSFQMNDLSCFNIVNLDVLFKTYNMPLYLQYMSTSPKLFTMTPAPNGSIMGCMFGKAKGTKELCSMAM
ncbi:hypothetical protein ACHAW6_004934, partial [Cyclotella cf. meneghiniana]